MDDQSHITEFYLGDLPPVDPGPPFVGPIFFGSPGCTQEVERAHAQLDEVFGAVSGLQQPAHCDSEECSRLCREADSKEWDRVRELARSLVRAMGVPDILK